MKKFMILVHGDDEAFARMPQEEAKAVIASVTTFENRLRDENAFIAKHRLLPASTAKVLRLRKSGRTLLDGPFTETKEQFGGYYLVQAKDIDTVVGWLELVPALMDSSLEVREVMDEERGPS